LLAYTSVAFWQGCSNQKAAEASRKAADTAACALRENQRQFKETLAEVKIQTQAQQDAAQASLIAANTAAKQLALLAEQDQNAKDEAGARLIYNNFKWTIRPDSETAGITFDIVNTGNSEATEIGIGNGVGSWQDDQKTPVEEEIRRVIETRPPIDPAGFNLEKDQPKTLGFVVTLTPGKAWYQWWAFTYLDIFGRTKTVCEIIHRGGPFRITMAYEPCPNLSDAKTNNPRKKH
jgi:hypothetical protein